MTPTLTEHDLRPDLVRRAETPEEREGIYRLRYAVYVDELSKDLPDADHDRRWLRDPVDDADGVTLFYTGTPDAITSTLRVQLWRPGTVPPDVRNRFTMDFFPGLDQLTLGEAGRLVITNEQRGNLLLPALSAAAYEHLVQQQSHVLFSYCAPGLLRHYQRLGYRTYPGQLIDGADGLRIPLINLVPDLRYYREIRSPLFPLVQRHYPAGPPQSFDLRRYARAVAASGRVETDTTQIWDDLQTNLRQDRRVTLLDGIPDDGIRTILGAGYTVQVPAGHLLTRANLIEQEVYAVLDGTFEELAPDGRRTAVLSTGDLLGDLSLFLPHGRRATSIRSTTAGRLLVLGRSFLTTLMTNDPPLAVQVLHNLARSMATRLNQSIDPAA
jgi:hypothetical protein